MFVVTGLHTKRRPPTSVDSSSATIEKHCVERPPTLSHRHRHLHLASPHMSFSSNQTAPRVPEPRITRNDSDRGACNRREMGRRPPIKVPPAGRPAPTRVRKFIPKPLILVERMKARQLLLESSPPVASESCVAPESVNRPTTAMTAPLSAYVTPITHRIPTCSILSNDSHSSGSVSFRVSSQSDVVFGSGFGMIPRSVRPLSVATPADSSSSTDTFVADSPCCIKQASKVPVLTVTSVHLNVESGSGKKSISDTGLLAFVDSVSTDFVHQTCRSAHTFEPFVTSTPFTSNQANTPGFSDSFEIVSPTSQEVYPFNAPKGAYAVKLPSPGSTMSLSNRTSPASLSSTTMSYSRLTKSDVPLAMLANAPKPGLGFRRPSRRIASPSPTLVLDGVFALPRTSSPSSSPSPRRTLSNLARPRKSTPRRPLSDISNALAIASPSQPLSPSPTPSRGQTGPESPRSRLAHVLTAHVQPQTTTRTRVPPLVKGVEVSNDPRTQREIERLRVRRAVGRGRGDGDGDGGGDVGGESGGRRVIERMSLASVGMVAKLRARWEMGGAVVHGGSVDGYA